MSSANSISKVTKILSQVDGIDKAYRLIIYSLRILQAAYPDKKDMVERMNGINGPLSETRVCLRLFGLIPMVKAVLADKNFLRAPRNDNELLDIVKTLSMFVYYPAEHIYFMGSHKVFNIANADSWSRISCRAWAVYIIADMISSYKRYRQVVKALEGGKSTDSSKMKELESEHDDLMFRGVNILADLCLAIHWSLESYPLPPIVVGVLGLVSAVCSARLKGKYTIV